MKKLYGGSNDENVLFDACKPDNFSVFFTACTYVNYFNFFISECTSYEFSCPSGGCIPNYYICDNDYDCSDGSDEDGCDSGNGIDGSGNGGKCKGFTVKKTKNVHFHASKPDNFSVSFTACTYENYFTFFYILECASNEFSCPSGGCIPNYYICDNYDDCSDGSDEDDWGSNYSQ